LAKYITPGTAADIEFITKAKPAFWLAWSYIIPNFARNIYEIGMSNMPAGRRTTARELAAAAEFLVRDAVARLNPIRSWVLSRRGKL
jgi:hypothetical protein